MNSMINRFMGLSAALGLAMASTASLAAEFVLDSAGLAKGSNSSTALVGFSGNSEITDAQVDVNYDPKAVKVSVKAFGNASCGNPKAGLIRVISPDLGGQALGEKMGAYCQITVTKLKGGSGSTELSLANAYCSGIGGAERACSAGNQAK